MSGGFRDGCGAFCRLVVLVLAAVLASASLALAHASLNHTFPADGALVETAPASFTLTFSEPVSPLALNLVRPGGEASPLPGFQVRDRIVEIAAPPDLGRGTHVLTWRVVSADGHPVGGSVVFSIGEVSSRAPVVGQPVERTVRAGLWLTRLVLYVGLFIGAGGVFARAVLMPGIASGRGTIAAALSLGLVASILSLGFQGLDALGAHAGRYLDPLVWSTGSGTSYGATVAASVAALALGLVALFTAGRARGAVAIAALLLAAIAPALSGHASAADPQWLMRPAVFLHALGIAVWIGALIPLGLSLRRREPAAARGLVRFSRAMPLVLAGLIAAGVTLAVVQLGTPAALTTTAYGLVFLLKLTLLAALFGLAAVNRWRLTGRVETGDPAAARWLVRSIAVETLAVVLVFGVTAAWRFTPPPRAVAAEAAQPAATHIHTGRAMADLTVSPGRTGEVEVSAVIMTGEFGPLDAKEVTFIFSNPSAGIEPFRRQAEKPGDGSWRAAGVVLPLPGTWTIGVDILISDFEIARIEGEVTIRP